MDLANMGGVYQSSRTANATCPSYACGRKRMDCTILQGFRSTVAIPDKRCESTCGSRPNGMRDVSLQEYPSLFNLAFATAIMLDR
jgi:hypothetical protein